VSTIIAATDVQDLSDIADVYPQTERCGRLMEGLGCRLACHPGPSQLVDCRAHSDAAFSAEAFDLRTNIVVQCNGRTHAFTSSS
jgi:hypothetical protein